MSATIQQKIERDGGNALPYHLDPIGRKTKTMHDLKE